MVQRKLTVTIVGLWCCLVGVLGQKEEPVAFTVLDKKTMHSSTTSQDGLPQEVDLAFDVFGSHVTLKLERNKKISSDRFYTIRKSEAGVPVLVKQTVPYDTAFGEYQDTTNNACFTLTCDNKETSNETNCTPTLEGSFVTDQVKYELRLLDSSSLHRTKRETRHLWNMVQTVLSTASAGSKLYGIYKTDPAVGTSGDFSDPFREEIVPRSAAVRRGEPRTVREDIIPGNDQYNVEVLAVIDFPVYERFFKSSAGQKHQERDMHAKSRIRKYFSHVFNGIDLLYRGVEGLGISVGVTGFVIADSLETSDFTSGIRDRVAGARDQVLARGALESIISWSFRSRNLPPRDHIMLFTGYDIYSSHMGVKDNNTAGYARVGAMCDLDSASVVEEHAGYQSIYTGAHELGHSLGARHDGSGNPCEKTAQNIMTSHGGFESRMTKANPWKFSICSVQYFRNFLNRLPRRNCLSDPMDVFDLDQFIKYVSTYPGQEVTPNEQCQDVLGLDSYYGWGSNLGSFSDVCTDMACAIPDRRGRYRVMKAVTGTSCGDKKWCMQGQCVFSPDAPTKDDGCVHGDSLQLFRGGKTCAQFIVEFPGRCYDKYLRSRCCDICSKIHTGAPECEFGDRLKTCDPTLCNVPRYARNCCSTCGRTPRPVVPTLARDDLVNNNINKNVDRATNIRTTTLKPTTTNRPFQTTTSRRNVWIRPAQRDNVWHSWRRVTSRPATAKPTTPRPPRMPRRRTTETAEPTNREPCLQLKESGTFLLMFRCSAVVRFFGENACSNSLVRDQCCEPCVNNDLVAQPSAAKCEDEPSCAAKESRDCYVTTVRSKCCNTCRRFETDIPNCKYGDRLGTCPRFLESLGFARVCRAYKHYCCQSCAAGGNDQSPPRPFGNDVSTTETIRVADQRPTTPSDQDTVWIHQKIRDRSVDFLPRTDSSSKAGSGSVSDTNNMATSRQSDAISRSTASSPNRKIRITFRQPPRPRSRFPVSFSLFRWRTPQ